jgi:hypothetical protein
MCPRPPRSPDRRVRAGDHLQHGGGVGHRSRHRAGDVGAEVQRHDARSAHQPHRRAQADERLVRGRSADRIAGVAGERDGAEIGGAPAADPPLEPAVTRLVSYGLRV